MTGVTKVTGVIKVKKVVEVATFFFILHCLTHF